MVAPPDIADGLFHLAFADLKESEIRRLRAEVARADSMGMRAGVFAKTGDSNIASYNSLYGLGCRTPIWDRYEWLEPTMLRYREISLEPGDGRPDHVPPADQRTPWNSFSRSSASARSGIMGSHLMEPSSRFSEGLMGWVPDADCLPEESMLHCEIRITRPRFAFVNLGTNEASFGYTSRETADRVGVVIDEIRQLGPAPVLMTIPPQLDSDGSTTKWDFARETSEWLVELAREKGVPLFNQWLALADERLVNHGLVEYDQGIFDGFHLETIGGFRAEESLGRSVDFRPQALIYGANLRNLLLLRALHALDAALD